MKIVFLIFAILFSTCSLEKKPLLIIPDENTDRVFTMFLDKPMSEKYDLPQLRNTALSKDDLEIRVWVSVGNVGIDVFILKRINKTWSAIAIKEVNCNQIPYYKGGFYQPGKTELSSPKSGWEKNWEKLIDANVLELPNYEENALIDGFGYTLELKTNNTYRVYNYFSPDFYQNRETDAQKRKNIEQMLKIGEIIADEFGLGNFKVSNMCL